MAALLAGTLPGAVHAQQRAQPLSVRLLAPSSAIDRPLRFVLNQPAYIAAFVVTPGQGVRMIYPLTNEEQLQWAGFHDESLLGLHFDDDAYNVVLGRPYWATGFGAGGFDGPSYLYVIASRWPLDVTRFVHHPATLQRAVGYDNARSFDSEEAFTGLLNNVVSLGADDSWDSDVYMLWAPEWIADAPHSFQEALRYDMATRVVTCRDGRSIIVPLNYWFSGCPGEARIVPVRQARPRTQRLASELPSPTVLPTIRGVRMARSANSKPEPVANGFLTSAAGGVTSTTRGAEFEDEDAGPQRGVTVIDEVPVYAGRPSRGLFVRGRGDGDHDRPDRGRGDAQGRERGWDHQQRTERGSPAPAPRPIGVPASGMAPAPRAAPAPEQARPPRMAPAPMMHSAPVAAPIAPPARVQGTQKAQ